MSVVKLNGSSFKKKRPAAAATTTTRPAKTYKVSESTVTGLDGELKFFPGKFYEFTVTGAGMDNTSPVQEMRDGIRYTGVQRRIQRQNSRIQPGELVLVKVLKTVQAIIFIFS